MAALENRDELRNWILRRLCSALNLAEADVDADTQFSHYALDSVDAVTFVMDLEEELGRELPSTLLWDYPTANLCVSFLLDEMHIFKPLAKAQNLA